MRKDCRRQVEARSQENTESLRLGEVNRALADAFVHWNDARRIDASEKDVHETLVFDLKGDAITLRQPPRIGARAIEIGSKLGFLASLPIHHHEPGTVGIEELGCLTQEREVLAIRAV